VKHNPQAKVPSDNISNELIDQAGKWVDLRPLGTEGQYSNLLPTDANYGVKPYSLIQPTIPIGVGVKIRMSKRLDVRCEFGVNYFFTDYLDDVSRNYVDLGALKSDLARKMSYKTPDKFSLKRPYSYVGRDGHETRL
jgi:hypothetical protein